MKGVVCVSLCLGASVPRGFREKRYEQNPITVGKKKQSVKSLVLGINNWLVHRTTSRAGLFSFITRVRIAYSVRFRLV